MCTHSLMYHRLAALLLAIPLVSTTRLNIRSPESATNATVADRQALGPASDACAVFTTTSTSTRYGISGSSNQTGTYPSTDFHGVVITTTTTLPEATTTSYDAQRPPPKHKRATSETNSFATTRALHDTFTSDGSVCVVTTRVLPIVGTRVCTPTTTVVYTTLNGNATGSQQSPNPGSATSSTSTFTVTETPEPIVVSSKTFTLRVSPESCQSPACGIGGNFAFVETANRTTFTVEKNTNFDIESRRLVVNNGDVAGGVGYTTDPATIQRLRFATSDSNAQAGTGENLQCRVETPRSFSNSTEELDLVCDSSNGDALAWYVCGNDPELQIGPVGSGDATSCFRLALQVRSPVGVADPGDGGGGGNSGEGNGGEGNGGESNGGEGNGDEGNGGEGNGSEGNGGEGNGGEGNGGEGNGGEGNGGEGNGEGNGGEDNGGEGNGGEDNGGEGNGGEGNGEGNGGEDDGGEGNGGEDDGGEGNGEGNGGEGNGGEDDGGESNGGDGPGNTTGPNFLLRVNRPSCNTPGCTDSDIYATPTLGDETFYAFLGREALANFTLSQGALTPSEGDAKGLVGYTSDLTAMRRLQFVNSSDVSNIGGSELNCTRSDDASVPRLTCQVSDTIAWFWVCSDNEIWVFDDTSYDDDSCDLIYMDAPSPGAEDDTANPGTDDEGDLGWNESTKSFSLQVDQSSCQLPGCAYPSNYARVQDLEASREMALSAEKLGAFHLENGYLGLPVVGDTYPPFAFVGTETEVEPVQFRAGPGATVTVWIVCRIVTDDGTRSLECRADTEDKTPYSFFACGDQVVSVGPSNAETSCDAITLNLDSPPNTDDGSTGPTRPNPSEFQSYLGPFRLQVNEDSCSAPRCSTPNYYVDADITASPVIASVDETGIDLQLDYGYLRPTELRGTGNQYIYAILNDLTVQPVRFVDVPDQGAESILWLMCRSLETGSRVTFECEVGNNATDDPPPVLISFFACDGSGTLYAGPTDATTDCQVIELDVASRSPDTPSGNEDDPTDGEGGFDYDLKDFQGYDGPFAMSINAASCQDACQYPSYFARILGTTPPASTGLTQEKLGRFSLDYGYLRSSDEIDNGATLWAYVADPTSTSPQPVIFRSAAFDDPNLVWLICRVISAQDSEDTLKCVAANDQEGSGPGIVEQDFYACGEDASRLYTGPSDATTNCQKIKMDVSEAPPAPDPGDQGSNNNPGGDNDVEGDIFTLMIDPSSCQLPDCTYAGQYATPINAGGESGTVTTVEKQVNFTFSDNDLQALNGAAQDLLAFTSDAHSTQQIEWQNSAFLDSQSVSRLQCLTQKTQTSPNSITDYLVCFAHTIQMTFFACEIGIYVGLGDSKPSPGCSQVNLILQSPASAQAEDDGGSVYEGFSIQVFGDTCSFDCQYPGYYVTPSSAPPGVLYAYYTRNKHTNFDITENGQLVPNNGIAKNYVAYIVDPTDYGPLNFQTAEQLEAQATVPLWCTTVGVGERTFLDCQMPGVTLQFFSCGTESRLFIGPSNGHAPGDCSYTDLIIDTAATSGDGYADNDIAGSQ